MTYRVLGGAHTQRFAPFSPTEPRRSSGGAVDDASRSAADALELRLFEWLPIQRTPAKGHRRP